MSSNNKPVLPGLSDGEQALQEKLLGSPLGFPLAFKNWLKGQVESDVPALPINQMLGYQTLTTSISDAANQTFELDYAEITSSVAIAATTEAGATTIVTSASVTYDGTTAIIIEFYAPQVAVDGTFVTFVLRDDTAAASLGLAAKQGSNAGAQVDWKRRLTPAAGARVYSARVFRTGGTTGGSNLIAGAGGSGNFVPAFLRIIRAS